MENKYCFINCFLLMIVILNTYLTHATFDDTFAWLCTPVSSIRLVDEFEVTKIIAKDFQLKKLIVLIRHGDRGPLLPIRDLDSLYCDPNDFGVINNTVNTELLDEYLLAVNANQINNVSVPTDSHCHTNQLTRTGILQELTLGSQLGKLYRTTVGLKVESSVKAYTTPSARTYESAFAFLYGFLRPNNEKDFETFPQIIKTSSYDFCLDSKYCEQNYTAINRNSTTTAAQQYNITTIAQAINYMQYFVPFIASNQSDTKLFNTPTQIGDAIITYFCHNASIPCVDKNNTEVCADSHKISNFTEFALALVAESSKWQTTRYENLKLMYAFLDNIFTITTSNSTDQNLVLFSAHDDTIISFLSAIGAYDGGYPSFASHVVIENYVRISGESEQNFMRIVYNGRDVTHLTDYCTNNATHCLSHESGVTLINVNMFNEFIVHKFNSIYEVNV